MTTEYSTDVILAEDSVTKTPITCVQWADAVRYVKKMSNKELTRHGCLQSMFVEAKRAKYTHCKLYRERAFNSGHIDLSAKPTLEIEIMATGNKNCNMDNSCAYNIANGKCTDPFVIQHIGAVFFPQHYKQHTR